MDPDSGDHTAAIWARALEEVQSVLLDKPSHDDGVLGGCHALNKVAEGSNLVATREALVWALAQNVVLQRTLDEERNARRRVQGQLSVSRSSFSTLHAQRSCCDGGSAEQVDSLTQQLLGGLSRLDAAELELEAQASRFDSDAHELQQLRSERAQIRDAAGVLKDACSFRITSLEQRCADAVLGKEAMQGTLDEHARSESAASQILRHQLDEANAGLSAMREAVEREQEQGQTRARALQANVRALLAQVSSLETSRSELVRALEAAEEKMLESKMKMEEKDQVVEKLDVQCLAYERALKEARGKGGSARARSKPRPATAPGCTGKENRPATANKESRPRAHEGGSSRVEEEGAARRPRAPPVAARGAPLAVAARGVRAAESCVGRIAGAGAGAALVEASGKGAGGLAGGAKEDGARIEAGVKRDDGVQREAARRVHARATAVRARGHPLASPPR
ncbi:hypothetical protein T484DRAFT_1894281 [Baffinella frigidus]|nr:hypothetical protein T484DRAFT_1894281 [Cryptophyta sp. CCMP2293]